jgi:hypothetical protein
MALSRFAIILALPVIALGAAGCTTNVTVDDYITVDGGSPRAMPSGTATPPASSSAGTTPSNGVGDAGAAGTESGGSQSGDAGSDTGTPGFAGTAGTLNGAGTVVSGDEGVVVGPPASGTSILDPAWQRSNEYFLAPGPWASNVDLQYYTANTYPLYNQDNSAAGSAFTWTTSDAWNGPGTTDMALDGQSAIPGFVPGDYWFWECCDVADDGVTGTTYWFRANVDLGPLSSLVSVTLEDKYHPGQITLNDGMILFIDGVAQPTMPNTGDADATHDSSETGWSFPALPVSTSALHDGVNEIAVMYSDIYGDGGLGHLVLSVDAE